jgi:ABC-2 type transport system permease protein
MPVLLFAVAVATHLLATVIMSVRPPPGLDLGMLWSPLALLEAYGRLGATLAINAVWYSPLVVYWLLASVLARRSPWVVAILPPLVISLAERLGLGTSYVSRWLGQRLVPRTDLLEALASPGLWLGLLCAGAAVLLVIRLRRWRDDS